MALNQVQPEPEPLTQEHGDLIRGGIGDLEDRIMTLESDLRLIHSNNNKQKIFACGPPGMMEAVKFFSDDNRPAIVKAIAIRWSPKVSILA